MFLTSKLSRRTQRPFIESNILDDKLTLDHGCGPGPYKALFKQRVGFDVAPGPAVDVTGDMHALPFEDNYFEQILSTEVLEHSYDPCKAVDELRRVLKPGGKLILTTRFVYPLHDTPHDFFRFTEFGLKHIFRREAGWKLEIFQGEATTQETLGILIQRVAFQSRVVGGKFTILCLHVLARCFFYFPNILRRQFGNIQKSSDVDNILVSGYYLVVSKL